MNIYEYKYMKNQCQMQGVLGPPIVHYYIEVTEQLLTDQPNETLVRILELFRNGIQTATVGLIHGCYTNFHES